MKDEEKLQAILNLVLTVITSSRKITPARKEHAEKLLLELEIPKAEAHWGSSYDPNPDRTWLRDARSSCPNWRTL